MAIRTAAGPKVPRVTILSGCPGVNSLSSWLLSWPSLEAKQDLKQTTQVWISSLTCQQHYQKGQIWPAKVICRAPIYRNIYLIYHKFIYHFQAVPFVVTVIRPEKAEVVWILRHLRHQKRPSNWLQRSLGRPCKQTVKKHNPHHLRGLSLTPEVQDSWLGKP